MVIHYHTQIVIYLSNNVQKSTRSENTHYVLKTIAYVIRTSFEENKKKSKKQFYLNNGFRTKFGIANTSSIVNGFVYITNVDKIYDGKSRFIQTSVQFQRFAPKQIFIHEQRVGRVTDRIQRSRKSKNRRDVYFF